MGPGTTRITADSVIGQSGKPTRVYWVSLVSGVSASTLTLRNGTGGSDTAYDQIDGTASQSVTKNYAGGILFPAGCYADVDANVSYVTVGHMQNSNA